MTKYTNSSHKQMLLMQDNIPEGYALYLNGVQMPIIPGGVPVKPSDRWWIGEALREVQSVVRMRATTYTNVTPGAVHTVVVPDGAIAEVDGGKSSALGPCVLHIPTGSTYRLDGGDNDTYNAYI